ncbi:hypothetical protein PIB30_076970, partial [Stylosanthes scabra]|nr:hypothetical protein [Stylosanthes scabra]
KPQQASTAVLAVTASSGDGNGGETCGENELHKDGDKASSSSFPSPRRQGERWLLPWTAARRVRRRWWRKHCSSSSLSLFKAHTQLGLSLSLHGDGGITEEK